MYVCVRLYEHDEDDYHAYGGNDQSPVRDGHAYGTCGDRCDCFFAYAEPYSVSHSLYDVYEDNSAKGHNLFHAFDTRIFPSQTPLDLPTNHTKGQILLFDATATEGQLLQVKMPSNIQLPQIQ